MLKKLIVTAQHVSEYPNPITLEKGTLIEVGEKYTGDGDWNDWYFCSVSGQEPGWVPGQIIERINETQGTATESYTANELNVEPGEILLATKELNGWIWCTRTSNSESGWVPLKNTRPIDK